MKCSICGSQKEHEQFKAQEMMLGLRDTFTYFQCRECACLQIDTIPSDISSFYPPEYHSFESVSKPNIIKQYLVNSRNRYAIFEDSLLGKLLYKRNPEPAIRSLSKISLSKSSRILDVGCGTGKLLFSLKELGFQNLRGIDPFNSENIQTENGVTIEKKNIHEIQGEWDLIMMHHSFEHVPDPQEVLKSIAERLSPSGRCIIRIPVVDSHAWKKFKENWVQLDAPRHFFLHSKKSMKLLGQKAGLTIQKIIYDSTAFQFWGSIQYEKGIPLTDKSSHAVNPDNSIFSKGHLQDFEQKAEELNNNEEGDQAVFIFSK